MNINVSLLVFGHEVGVKGNSIQIKGVHRIGLEVPNPIIGKF